MTKRSPSDVWEALEEETMDAELESVLAMTPEERRRELREAGFDLEKVHAQSDALFAAALATAPRPESPPQTAPVTALRPKRPRLAVVIPSALALAAAAALVVILAQPPTPVAHPRPDPARAEVLRKDARDACEARRWQTCLAELNEAKALDPRGDEAPEVQSLRRAATEGTGHR